MKISNIVNFEKIEKRLKDTGSKERAGKTIEYLTPNEDYSLDEITWGVDVEKFIGVSVEEMISSLYERLVPVHQLERGMLPVIYAINNQVFEDNEDLPLGDTNFIM